MTQDTRAEQQLMQRIDSPEIKAVVRAIIRDRNAWEDALQDIAVRILLAFRRGKIDETGDLQWHVRTKAEDWRNRQFHNQSRRATGAPIDAAADMLDPRMVTPLEAAEESEAIGHLWRKVAALPRRERAILTAKAKGLHVREIATLSGLRPNQIRSKLYRGRLRLWRALAPGVQRFEGWAMGPRFL